MLPFLLGLTLNSRLISASDPTELAYSESIAFMAWIKL